MSIGKGEKKPRQGEGGVRSHYLSLSCSPLPALLIVRGAERQVCGILPKGVQVYRGLNVVTNTMSAGPRPTAVQRKRSSNPSAVMVRFFPAPCCP